MRHLKKRVWIVKRLLQKYINKLFALFVDQAISDDLWLLKWIMTIFTMVLPGILLVRIWDLFLIKGLNFLYKVILAILQLIEIDLFEKDTGDICEYLSDIKLHLLDPDEFFKCLYSIKISKSLIEKLERDYEAIELSYAKEKIIPENCKMFFDVSH